MGILQRTMEAWPLKTGERPRVPVGVRVYAVGDIHGHLDLLQDLQRQMDEDQAAHPNRAHIEIYLGDYVDRGPASPGVLDALMERRRSRGAICLSGNHEELMLESYTSFERFSHWLRVGGLHTAVSYMPRLVPVAEDLEPRYLWHRWRGVVPEAHLGFLKGLGLFHTVGDYLFVHAGIRPSIPLERQRRKDLLWIRRDFLDHREPFDHVVVHGHTPVAEPEIRANRIGIDTGAFASRHLTCLVLDGTERYILST